MAEKVKLRTRTGGAATANNTRRTSGGHMADKLRRRGQTISRPAFFFLHGKLFGEVTCLGNYIETCRNGSLSAPLALNLRGAESHKCKHLQQNLMKQRNKQIFHMSSRLPSTQFPINVCLQLSSQQMSATGHNRLVGRLETYVAFKHQMDWPRWPGHFFCADFFMRGFSMYCKIKGDC